MPKLPHHAAGGMFGQAASQGDGRSEGFLRWVPYPARVRQAEVALFLLCRLVIGDAFGRVPLVEFHPQGAGLDSRILVAPLLRFLHVIGIEDEDVAKIALDAL